MWGALVVGALVFGVLVVGGNTGVLMLSIPGGQATVNDISFDKPSMIFLSFVL